LLIHIVEQGIISNAPTNNSPLTEDQGEVEGGVADEQNSIY
jgi:hypothetical protein